MKKFKIKSYCKVNLYLRIVKKLSNGFHNINSLVTFCYPYDVISIYKIKGLKDKIIFLGRFKKGINRKLNTITKVLYFLRRRKFFKTQAFKIKIKPQMNPEK